jgi:hypothetical protein
MNYDRSKEVWEQKGLPRYPWGKCYRFRNSTSLATFTKSQKSDALVPRLAAAPSLTAGAASHASYMRLRCTLWTILVPGPSRPQSFLNASFTEKPR